MENGRSGKIFLLVYNTIVKWIIGRWHDIQTEMIFTPDNEMMAVDIY